MKDTINWAAIEAAVNDASNPEGDGIYDIRTKVKELCDHRYSVKQEASRQAHIAKIRGLDPNTELVYTGTDPMFFNKTMLLEKCNPKYVIVQIKDMPKRKGWSRWNMYYRDVRTEPLTEQDLSSRRVGQHIARVLGSIPNVR